MNTYSYAFGKPINNFDSLKKGQKIQSRTVAERKLCYTCEDYGCGE